MPLSWGVVFLYGFLLDVFQVLYTASIVKNRTLRAANLSVVYSAIAAGAVVSVVENRWLFLPYLAGVWLGSLSGMVLKSSALTGSAPRRGRARAA
jgi:hypothetical protein